MSDDFAAIAPIAINVRLTDCGVGGIMSEKDFTALCDSMVGQPFRFKWVDESVTPKSVRMFTDEREVVVDHTTGFLKAVVKDCSLKAATGIYDDACEQDKV